jgi:hypothetical protein
MSSPSYGEIREQIRHELGDLAPAEARECLVERLTELRFELNRLKEDQRTLLVALRARDIVMREQWPPNVVPVGSIDLDPRDALDAADGFHDMEWDQEVAFRWTGPSHDTLVRVWLDRAIPILLEIALLSYGDERNRGAVTLTVDGVPLPIREINNTLLRSDPFPVAAASLYTEVGIHVPWLTGGKSTILDGHAAEGRSSAARSRRSRATRTGSNAVSGDQRICGIAITRMRFLSPA